MQLAEIIAVVSLVVVTMDTAVTEIHVSILMNVPLVTITVTPMLHAPTPMEALSVAVMQVIKEPAQLAEISMNVSMEMIVMLMLSVVIRQEVTRVTAEEVTVVTDLLATMSTSVKLTIIATKMPHVVIPLGHMRVHVTLDMKVTG